MKIGVMIDLVKLEFSLPRPCFPLIRYENIMITYGKHVLVFLFQWHDFPSSHLMSALLLGHLKHRLMT